MAHTFAWITKLRIYTSTRAARRALDIASSSRIDRAASVAAPWTTKAKVRLQFWAFQLTIHTRASLS